MGTLKENYVGKLLKERISCPKNKCFPLKVDQFGCGGTQEVKKVILTLKHGNVLSHHNVFDSLHFVHRMFIVYSGKPNFLGDSVYKIMHVKLTRKFLQVFSARI